MAQKPISARSQIQLDPHDKATESLSIDGLFVGYVSKPVAQYIRLASADVAAHDATKRELAAIREAWKPIIERHQREAVRANFQECGCVWCEAYRAASPAAPAQATTQEGGA